MLIIYYQLSLILQSQAFISWVVWATFSFALLCTVLMRSVITARLAIISAGPSTRLVPGSTTAPLMSTARQYFISAPLLIVWLHHIHQHCLNTVLRTDLTDSPLTFKSHSFSPGFVQSECLILTPTPQGHGRNLLVSSWETEAPTDEGQNSLLILNVQPRASWR